MVLTDEQRQVGSSNFSDAVGLTRRELLGLGAALPGVTAFYWGYERMKGDPVRVGMIGTGDQGCAHIASVNTDYVKVLAVSDIRPSNQKRARIALENKFGAADARKVEFYEDYHRLLDRGDLDMVIISLPLHMHAPVTIEAMEKGKHVLCEKLMAKTVTDCKKMVQAARRTNRLLAIGHQRHYSYLYANALDVVRQKEIIGDVRHIRAFWHRNQTGGGKPGAEKGEFDGWHRTLPPEDKSVDYKKYGYKSLEELVRWRIYQRTGGGLMAELGSHQLDACGIFLTGILGKKDPSGAIHPVHPLAVSGIGVKSFFSDDRESEDHVFLNYEYEGGIVVSYSSISTNAVDNYGEQVMGTKATLLTLAEREVYLFKEMATKDTRITWAENRVGQPTATSTSTTKWAADVGTPDTLTSRGYREEQEHLAWLIRNPGHGQPRCNGEVAMGDAVVTLASTLAMRDKRRVEFKPEWFNPDSKEVPDPNEPNTA
jgi:predicted dehydrogenase